MRKLRAPARARRAHKYVRKAHGSPGYSAQMHLSRATMSPEHHCFRASPQVQCRLRRNSPRDHPSAAHHMESGWPEAQGFDGIGGIEDDEIGMAAWFQAIAFEAERLG